MNNFKARKNRQIYILTNRLDSAREELNQIERINGEETTDILF